LIEITAAEARSKTKRPRTAETEAAYAATIASTKELASAIRALSQPPPPPPQGAHDGLKADLAEAVEVVRGLIAKRGTVFEHLERLERMAEHNLFYATQAALEQEQVPALNAQIAEAEAAVVSLREALKAAQKQN
jgi:hypothetical protein